MMMAGFAASANEEKIIGEDWVRFDNTSSMSNFSDVQMNMNLVATGEDVYFGIFILDDPTCDGYVKENVVIFFENQAVKMRQWCNNGNLMRSPKTHSGNDFIINKFKSLNYVRVGTTKWNAKGFTKQYNQLVRASKAL